MSLNKVMLIGRCGKDPDVRSLENNGKVASFAIATKEKYKDRSGNVKDETTWHNCVAYGAIASIIERFVKKGTQIYLDGRLRKRKWTDRDGNEKETTEVVVANIELLDGKREGGENGGYQASDF